MFDTLQKFFNIPKGTITGHDGSPDNHSGAVLEMGCFDLLGEAADSAALFGNDDPDCELPDNLAILGNSERTSPGYDMLVWYALVMTGRDRCGFRKNTGIQGDTRLSGLCGVGSDVSCPCGN